MKTIHYHYFITPLGAVYRAQGSIAQGEFRAKKIPDMFTSDGWGRSAVYKQVEDFQCHVDTGTVIRASLLKACMIANGDVVMFAPTLSSRLASKRHLAKTTH